MNNDGVHLPERAGRWRKLADKVERTQACLSACVFFLRANDRDALIQDRCLLATGEKGVGINETASKTESQSSHDNGNHED